MRTKDGLWKLSPSGLYGFHKCKACFWLENHHGKPPSLPWLLNSAMDSVLKARYDFYREKNEFPPEIAALKKEGIKFFNDSDILNKWRGHSSHLKIVNKEIGYELAGKIDDVLTETDDRLIPVDFKSSGYAPKEDKKKYYLDQLNAYALMFREHGYPPSDRAFLFHYFVKNTKNPSLNVEFESHIDLVKIEIPALEKMLADIVNLLNGHYPGDDIGCEACVYFEGRGGMKNKK